MISRVRILAWGFVKALTHAPVIYQSPGLWLIQFVKILLLPLQRWVDAGGSVLVRSVLKMVIDCHKASLVNILVSPYSMVL